MLMGFPLDLWSSEHVHNAIASFGKVITWENDPSHLARILVKARVTNLEDVPRHIVLSESEGFQGQSWTIQCEIIHQGMLDAQPQDEEVPPIELDLEQNPPFDFFSLGQPVNNVAMDQGLI
jgi:hypothetical protein